MNGEKQSINTWLTLIPSTTRMIHTSVNTTNAGISDINDLDTSGGTVSGNRITKFFFWKKWVIVPVNKATKIPVNKPLVPNKPVSIVNSSVNVASKNATTDTKAVINGSIFISVYSNAK